MQNRNQLFDFAIDQGATDIHICAGAPILLRIGRKLKPVTEDKLTPEKNMVKKLATEAATAAEAIRRLLR